MPRPRRNAPENHDHLTHNAVPTNVARQHLLGDAFPVGRHLPSHKVHHRRRGGDLRNPIPNPPPTSHPAAYHSHPMMSGDGEPKAGGGAETSLNTAGGEQSGHGSVNGKPTSDTCQAPPANPIPVQHRGVPAGGASPRSPPYGGKWDSPDMFGYRESREPEMQEDGWSW